VRPLSSIQRDGDSRLRLGARPDNPWPLPSEKSVK
jgi:hypothetical protein